MQQLETWQVWDSARSGLWIRPIVLWALMLVPTIGLAQDPPTPMPAGNQDETSSDTDADSESETADDGDEGGLPLLEEMELPSADELFKRSNTNREGQPLDWVVLRNQRVIVTKPVYPRPRTLEKMQQAIDESSNWPRPQNDAERAQQRQDRAMLYYLVIELVGEPEYQLHMREIEQIIHHEDLMLRRIDVLIEEGRLREAFEMLFILERSYDDWPGAAERGQQLVFRDAQLKAAAGQLETALALFEDLHSRNNKFAGLSAGVGSVVDQLITTAVKNDDFNKARHFVSRLRRLESNHPVVGKWTSQFSNQSTELLNQAVTASQNGQHDVAATLASEAARIWTIPTNRRAIHRRIIDRYQRLHVGVERLADEPTAYFLSTAADRREKYLLQSGLFDLARNEEVPQFSTRFIEQWEPTDLGRRIDFRLRQQSAYWETRPELYSTQVVAALAARMDPGDPLYDERFAAYVKQLSIVTPYEFTIEFNRVPLRTESLLAFPIADRVDQPDGQIRSVPLTRRFEKAGSDGDQAVYRRSLPEPDRVPVYHVAEVVEHKYSDYRKLVQAFMRREIQMIPQIRPWDYEAFSSDNRFFTLQYANPDTHVLQFNPQSKPLRNRELRRALAYAINRERILKSVMLRDQRATFGQLSNGPFSNGSYAHNPTVGQREYDLTLGLALAIAARKALGDEIPKLRMLCPPDPVIEQAAREFIAAWKRIKIDVELIPNDGSVTIEGSESADWDIVYCTTQMAEPLVDLWPFLTMQPTARIDDLNHLPDWLRLELIQLDSINSWPAAIEQLRMIHRHLMQEVHLIPLWETENFLVVWRTVSGLPDTEKPMHAYQNIERWIYKPQ